MYGCDAYAYGLLASGCCDVVAEADLAPYDFMALVPVIEGAGGTVTDWKGGALRLHCDDAENMCGGRAHSAQHNGAARPTRTPSSDSDPALVSSRLAGRRAACWRPGTRRCTGRRCRCSSCAIRRRDDCNAIVLVTRGEQNIAAVLLQ